MGNVGEEFFEKTLLKPASKTYILDRFDTLGSTIFDWIAVGDDTHIVPSDDLNVQNFIG